MKTFCTNHGKVDDAVFFHQRACEGRVRVQHVGAVFFVAEAFFLVAVDGHAEHFAGRLHRSVGWDGDRVVVYR